MTRASPAAAKVAAARIAAAGSLPSSPRASSKEICFEQSELWSQGNVDTVVGEYHTANGIVSSSSWFKYGQTADTSADVGIKVPGGSWSVGGSVHVGNSTGSTVTEPGQDQFGYKLKSGFLHQDWYYYGCSDYYQEQAAQWTLSPDGLTLGDYNHNLDNNCKNNVYYSKFYPGQTFERDTNSFTHFSLAFSAFGFDGGAQSGSSTDVKAQWHWDSTSSVYYLCGNDDYISSAHRIYAGYG